VAVAGGALALDAALDPGWYVAEVGRRRGAFGVGLFDAGEADVRAAARAARPPTLAPARGAPADASPPWVRFALWALVVAGLEWMVFHAARSE
jgi:hypothetical protein